MQQTQYLPNLQRSIGASYLLRQTAGAELFGGLQVTLSFSASPPGEISIVETLYASNGKMHREDKTYALRAVEGILQYAQEQAINLEQFDIELSQFLIHPVDSREHVFFLTAQNAFQSAISSWNMTRY